MHNVLEGYLVEVAAHLTPLPKARREDDVAEMRYHLLSVAQANQQRGQSEEEAAANALRQFGPPASVGGELLWAWRREQARRRRSFWGAAACAAALSFLLPRCMNIPVTSLVFCDVLRAFGPDAFFYAYMTTNYALHTLAGGISGAVFGRRGIAGAVLAVALWYGLPAIRVGTGLEWVYKPAIWVLDYAEFALLAILAAWVGSLWRRECTPSRC